MIENVGISLEELSLLAILCSDYLVIDGQQRITTVSLLLLAMANLIKDGKVIPEDDTLYAQITKKYLVDEINPKNRNLG